MKRLVLTALRVTLHMRSGARLNFHCETFTTNADIGHGGPINRLNAEDCRDFPHQIDLSQVCAITRRLVLYPRFL